MKRFTFLLILALSCSFFSSWGQVSCLNLSNKEIISMYEDSDSLSKVSFSKKFIKTNQYWYLNDTLTRLDTVVELKVLIEAETDKVEIDFFFDHDQNVCDSIVMKMFCSDCVPILIDDLLMDEYWKWKKFDANTYFSATSIGKGRSFGYVEFYSPKIVVKKTPKNRVCATICFSIARMEKKKWKKFIKSL
jgi:hypothetical protein